MSRLLLVLTVLAAISCASEAKAQHRHRAGYQPLGAVSDPFGAVRGVYGLERAASRNTWPVSGPYVYPMTPSYFPPAYRRVDLVLRSLHFWGPGAKVGAGLDGRSR